MPSKKKRFIDKKNATTYRPVTDSPRHCQHSPPPPKPQPQPPPKPHPQSPPKPPPKPHPQPHPKPHPRPHPKPPPYPQQTEQSVLKPRSAEGKEYNVTEDVKATLQMQANRNTLPLGQPTTDYRCLRSTEDGNCLYNSISLLLQGNELSSGRLRQLVALELDRNIDNYIDSLQILSVEKDIDFTVM